MAKLRRRKLTPLPTALCLCWLVSLLLLGLSGQRFNTFLSRHQPGMYSVVGFVDGDTIQVAMEGKTETVRFIGVDTPETHKPNTPVQCFGPNAAAYTRQLIGSSRVRLAADPYSTNRDRYGRLLRYVYLPDGQLVNEILIKTGHGFYYPYFPFSKSAAFAGAENAAVRQTAGLWRQCHPSRTPGGGHLSNPL